jgi:hypothetical protein
MPSIPAVERITNERGLYRIPYTAEQFSHNYNAHANLIVRAFEKEVSGEF